MKWREVKGIRSEEEIEYFQGKGLNCDKWNEKKGLWSAGKSVVYSEKVRKVLNEVKWSEVKGFWSMEENEYFQEQGLEIG